MASSTGEPVTVNMNASFSTSVVSHSFNHTSVSSSVSKAPFSPAVVKSVKINTSDVAELTPEEDSTASPDGSKNFNSPWPLMLLGNVVLIVVCSTISVLSVTKARVVDSWTPSLTFKSVDVKLVVAWVRTATKGEVVVKEELESVVGVVVGCEVI